MWLNPQETAVWSYLLKKYLQKTSFFVQWYVCAVVHLSSFKCLTGYYLMFKFYRNVMTDKNTDFNINTGKKDFYR